jgi:hypothetical protein
MELAQALPILEALANGSDPITGQALAAEHLCQHPQIVRALSLAVQVLRRQAPLPVSQARRDNAGKPWTAEERGPAATTTKGGPMEQFTAEELGLIRVACQMAADTCELGGHEEQRRLFHAVADKADRMAQQHLGQQGDLRAEPDAPADRPRD